MISSTYHGFQPAIRANYRVIMALTRDMWSCESAAAMTGSKDLFAEALLLDGAVGEHRAAIEMARDFIEAQRAFLPMFG